jgi:mRNA interferase MazF
MRPALVIADAGRGDWIACQITSNPYADPSAVELDDAAFAHGGLQRLSYARPAKLFTAHDTLFATLCGALSLRQYTRRQIGSVSNRGSQTRSV